MKTETQRKSIAALILILTLLLAAAWISTSTHSASTTILNSPAFRVLSRLS